MGHNIKLLELKQTGYLTRSFKAVIDDVIIEGKVAYVEMGRLMSPPATSTYRLSIPNKYFKEHKDYKQMRKQLIRLMLEIPGTGMDNTVKKYLDK